LEKKPLMELPALAIGANMSELCDCGCAAA